MTINDFLTNSSRQMVDEGAAFVRSTKGAFDLMIQKAFENEGKESWRAARIIDISCEGNEKLIRPYIPDICTFLPKLNESSQRSFLRLFSRLDTIEFGNHAGLLINFCFEALTDMNKPVAVKAISMTIIYAFGAEEPDLLNELKLIIEDMAEYMSPAFKGRARQLFGKNNLTL